LRPYFFLFLLFFPPLNLFLFDLEVDGWPQVLFLGFLFPVPGDSFWSTSFETPTDFFYSFQRATASSGKVIRRRQLRFFFVPQVFSSFMAQLH